MNQKKKTMVFVSAEQDISRNVKNNEEHDFEAIIEP